MWNWITGASKHDDKRTHSFFSNLWTQSILALPADPIHHDEELTLDKLSYTYSQLKHFRKIPNHLLIESLRAISEYLVFADQHHRLENCSAEAIKAAAFFDFFGEKNILSLLLEMGNASLDAAVQIQILQTLWIWL